MDRKTRIAVVLNAASGDGSAEAAHALLAARFRDAGIDAQIALICNADQLQSIVTAAIADDVTALVAGGGDGTVNAVANAIADREIALGIVPLGTLNHFAKDLGVPEDLAAAADVIAAGHTVRVDVGEVNGRRFLNNSSVGLYPRIVELRERYRVHGFEKWIIAAWATWRVTSAQQPFELILDVDGRDTVRQTPLLFIGNNAYRMEGFDAASRESLNDGQLAIYVVKASGQRRLIRLVWRILTGTARKSGELAMSRALSATVSLPASARITHVNVAIDGEVEKFALPLHYQIRPGALRVIVPG